MALHRGRELEFVGIWPECASSRTGAFGWLRGLDLNRRTLCQLVLFKCFRVQTNSMSRSRLVTTSRLVWSGSGLKSTWMENALSVEVQDCGLNCGLTEFRKC